MRAKLFAASLFTLGILSGFVFTILISAAYFGGKIEAGMMIGLTIFFNVILWLVSPWLTDLIQGWVYKIEKVEFADFERRFPKEGTSPRKTTVFELMCDAYASPLRGQFVEVEGKIIGRAEAGSTISEDMMMQDKSGGLIVLNYESLIPFIGNLFFGWRKAGKLEGQAGVATGWFRRSIGQFLDLQTFKMSSETITSYTRFWGMFGGVVVALAGFVILFASAAVK